jgi:hypothetical protein
LAPDPREIAEISASLRRLQAIRTGILAAIGLTATSLALALAMLVYMISGDIPVTFRGVTIANDPISILPREPDGVTVVTRQQAEERLLPQDEGASQPSQASGEEAPLPALEVSAPVAEGAEAIRGYAMELGSAISFAELSARFAEISDNHAEAGLDQLEPRATLRESAQGLRAFLLAGPFEAIEAASAACETLALPAGIECRAAPFEGQLISRR